MGEQVTMVDVDTVKDWIDADAALIVDVREQHEYDAEHIHGATLVPLSTFDPRQFPAVPEGKNLVLHCRSASRCGVAASKLIAAGYTGPIHRMAGGMIAWVNAGLPVE